MADRVNHYERAFRAFLHSRRLSMISVDETRRSFAQADSELVSLKSLDFILPFHDITLLIDVKGRKVSHKRRTLQTWVTEEDIRSMRRWQEVFGAQSKALLSFVYHLPSEEEKADFTTSFSFNDRHYGCLVCHVDDYAEQMKTRSVQWGTVSVNKKNFLSIARPLDFWLPTNDEEPDSDN